MSHRGAAEGEQPAAGLVSVIIPFRDATEFFGEQLDALARQDFDGPWEIVVVDNGSTVGPDRLVDEHAARLPTIRVVHAPGRRGPAHARNVGASEAHGDLLVFCDADDVCADDWLRQITTVAPHADLVGGRLEYQTSKGHRDAADRGVESPKLFGYVASFSTANMAIRHDVFDELGAFDERFDELGSAEDVDFCWRAQEAGYDVRFAPDAVVRYRLRGSLGAFARQQFRFGRGEVAFVCKHADEGLARVATRYEMRRFVFLLRHLADVFTSSQARRRWVVWVAKRLAWFRFALGVDPAQRAGHPYAPRPFALYRLVRVKPIVEAQPVRSQ